MNGESKRVVLISASPKMTEKTTSGQLASMQEVQMKAAGLDVYRVDVRKSLSKGGTQADFEAMLEADALVFTFPLYIFCLPGILMRFLQDYDQFRMQHIDRAREAKVYAVVNCGFPEADINEEAVRVIRSFSRKIGAFFRFGVLIGGGTMVVEAKDAPFMKKTTAKLLGTFDLMVEDILTDSRAPLEAISIQANFPRKLYFFMADRGWFATARKNGLKKKDLYRRPYRQNS